MGLAGCSSADGDDAVVPDVVGSITADLSMSVSLPQADGLVTRMSAYVAQAQENPKFRGIQDVRLIPFTVQGTIGPDDELVPVSIGMPSRQGSTTNFLAQNVDLQIGTASFLAYAKAQTTKPDDVTDAVWAKEKDFRQGSLVPCEAFTEETYTKPSDITFQLQQIYSESTSPASATAIADYLTSIAKAKGWRTADDVPALKNLYTDFTANGARAGSSANVQAMLSSLTKELAKTAWSGTDADIVSNIKAAIQGSGNSTASINDDNNTVTLTGSALTGYPASINLPDGSASIRWNTVLKPKETEDDEADGDETEEEMEEDVDASGFVVSEAGVGLDMNDRSLFAYPAELYYQANSRIRTSTSSQASHYPDESWSEVLGSYDSENGVVSVTTRSVALADQLDYGVSCLELSIMAAGVAEGSKHYLIEGSRETANRICLEDLADDAFPLTGVFVGGQYPVDYNFKPSDGTTDEDARLERIIYDRDIVSGVSLTQAESAANYTLVLQTKLHRPVSIVLEFENKSGREFRGYQGGLIYPGTHFYLTGKVIPSVTTTDPDEKQRVFKRDYKTKLLLKVQSLVNAYNVIPDLKTAQHDLEVASVAVSEWNDIKGKDKSLYNW